VGSITNTAGVRREPIGRISGRHRTFPLGTDPLGRDVASRIVYGARISLVVGFTSVLIGTVVGTLIGLVSGYLEGPLDSVLQRGVDTVMAVPGIVLALAIVSVLGQSLRTSSSSSRS
jgi:ABC-type dipeptide/oligopeptide/nickel transport system permease subunit